LETIPDLIIIIISSSNNIKQPSKMEPQEMKKFSTATDVVAAAAVDSHHFLGSPRTMEIKA